MLNTISTQKGSLEFLIRTLKKKRHKEKKRRLSFNRLLKLMLNIIMTRKI